MADTKRDPQGLSDALRRLESATGRAENGDGAIRIKEDVEKIRAALDDLKTHLNEVAGEALGDTLKSAKEKLRQGQARAKEMGKELDETVRENPWWAVGIIGLVAFLLGFLLGRKD